MGNVKVYSILIISPVYYPYHLGGAEVSTQMLAESLNEDPHFDIDILTHGYGDNDDDDDVINGVRVIRHNFRPFSKQMYLKIHSMNVSTPTKILGKIGDLFSFRARRRYYQSLFSVYDIVISSGNGVNMGRTDMWLAAKSVGTPFIQIIRDPLLLYPLGGVPTRFKALEKMYRKISVRGFCDVPYVVGITEWILDRHIKNGIAIQNQKVIYNMVDDKLCSVVPYGEKGDIILYVGSVSTQKGCSTLLSAFFEVSHLMPSFRLMLIGKQVDVEAPVDERIIAKGHIGLEETYVCMQRAKLLILPSEWDEAFGRVLIEAVFNGTVAIGSRAGGIPEVFDHNEEYLFEAGNIRSMADAMVKYATMDEERYDAVLKTQQDLFSRYRRSCVTDVWTDYLNHILEN